MTYTDTSTVDGISLTVTTSIASCPTTISSSSSVSSPSSLTPTTSSFSGLSSTTYSSSSSTLNASSVSSLAPTTSSRIITTSSSTAQLPSAAACPASNGTVITSSGKQFQVECFIDRQSAQIAVKAASTFTDCTNACALTAGCWAVSFANKYCYLKGALSLPVPNSNVWGARLMADGPISMSTSASLVSRTSSALTSASVTSTLPTVSASAMPTLTCPSSGSTSYNTSTGGQYFIECFIDHQVATWQCHISQV